MGPGVLKLVLCNKYSLGFGDAVIFLIDNSFPDQLKAQCLLSGYSASSKKAITAYIGVTT